MRTVPFEIDAPAIAQGLLDLFDDNERVALRFGMLPFTKIECLKKSLRDKFLENATSIEGDKFLAITNVKGRRLIEFSMNRLVEEATHLVSLALYDIGDLVV